MTHRSALSRSLSSIEELDQVPRELGWPLEYRQLEPGSFSSTMTMLESDSWFFLEEQSSRRVEVEAASPADMFVLALTEGDPGVVNGQSMTSDHVFLQPPGSDFLATLPAGMAVTQLGIANDQFEDVILAVAPDLLVTRRCVLLQTTAPELLASVRLAMRNALFAPSRRDAMREEAVSRILTDFVAVLDDHGRKRSGRPIRRAAAQRALGRAREYIEAHTREAIRVTSVCRYAGTTLRSLERVFARTLGVSPQQYVKARRLNAVRRRLLAADGEQNIRVTEVAQDHGFAHLGRFASDYRRYFGESPRETLRHLRPCPASAVPDSPNFT